MKNFSRWPANYKFGYICACVAALIGAVGIIYGIVVHIPAQTMVMLGLSLSMGTFLAVSMPRWAQDADEEKLRREQAAANRAEYKRFKKQQ